MPRSGPEHLGSVRNGFPKSMLRENSCHGGWVWSNVSTVKFEVHELLIVLAVDEKWKSVNKNWTWRNARNNLECKYFIVKFP